MLEIPVQILLGQVPVQPDFLIPFMILAEVLAHE